MSHGSGGNGNLRYHFQYAYGFLRSSALVWSTRGMCLGCLGPHTPETTRAPPASPPPNIVVHAVKECMNAAPPSKQVDLLEVVLPEPPTPSPTGEPAPSGGRTIGLRSGSKDSEDDFGETVVDASFDTCPDRASSNLRSCHLPGSVLILFLTVGDM